MEQPLVLVVIPLFNARSFIASALNSILTQTYQNLKILVINDGSTDGSEKIVEEYQDRRVILWHQENQGPGAAMNRAIQYAHEKGIEFIARMDADDISLPDRINIQMNLLLNNPAVAACSANCYYIDPISENIVGTSTVPTNRKLIHWELIHGLRGMIQGSLLGRTKALFQVGGYRTKFAYAEETDFFLRLDESQVLHNSDNYLLKIRMNADSLSMKNSKENILYQFYALDCAKRRKSGDKESEFKDYLQALSTIEKYFIWREGITLLWWRKYLVSKNIRYLFLSTILDPKRAISRILRKVLTNP